MNYNRIPENMEVLSPDNLSDESLLDETMPDLFIREFGDVFNEIKDHLTKEELLCVALFKNSKKRQHNNVYRVFFKQYYKTELTSSAITHRKRRMLAVLRHVGTLLRFKREHGVDDFLKDILTKKQYSVLILYEKRLMLSEMSNKLNLKVNTISQVFTRTMRRLKVSTNPLIVRYLELLDIVLRFSYKRKLG
jgi:DNA-binding NarL/FixJ family response regulator